MWGLLRQIGSGELVGAATIDQPQDLAAAGGVVRGVAGTIGQRQEIEAMARIHVFASMSQRQSLTAGGFVTILWPDDIVDRLEQYPAGARVPLVGTRSVTKGI